LFFRKLKPLHGWRAFWGEVGIIVLGVLIALGAQQLLESWSWAGQVRDFREASDYELGENLTILNHRLSRSGCVDRRLSELERLLVATDGPMPKRIAPINEVDNYTYAWSVWRNKDAAVTAHLPVALRTRYATMYDEFENLDTKRIQENDVWRELGQFNLSEPLDHADRLRLTELMGRARMLNSNINYNWQYAIRGMAKGLDIRPRELPYRIDPHTDFCSPFLAPA
jgi:hypothetical protein